MKRISIVIPVYNVAPYIASSLRSALSQTYGNIEFLIIDDCGTDGSMSVAEEFIRVHGGGREVKVISHGSNRGLSAARNTGLENATGDYVYFMDSDDEITPDCIEKLCSPLGERDVDMVFGNIRLIGADSHHIKDLRGGTVEGEDILKDFLSGKYNVAAVNKLYRKSFLDSNGLRFVDGILHEDILFSYQCCSAADTVKIVPEHTYLYKIRNNSISQSRVSRKRLDDLAVIIETFKRDRNGASAGLRPYFDRQVQYLVFLTSLQLLRSELSDSERKACYRRLRGGGMFFRMSLFSVLNLLPYRLFSAFIGTLYSAYKK